MRLRDDSKIISGFYHGVTEDTEEWKLQLIRMVGEDISGREYKTREGTIVLSLPFTP